MIPLKKQEVIADSAYRMIGTKWALYATKDGWYLSAIFGMLEELGHRCGSGKERMAPS